MVKLFERTADGYLVEITSDKTEESRKGRRWSHIVNAEYDVLWTHEEEAAHDAEEAAEAERAQQETAELEAARALNDQRRDALKEKLGLTDEDLAVLRG